MGMVITEFTYQLEPKEQNREEAIKKAIKKEILNKISTDKIADRIENIFELRALLSLNCEESIKRKILNKISTAKISTIIDSIYKLEDLLELNCEEKIKKEILNKISTDKIADGINSISEIGDLLRLICEEKIKKEILNKISTDKIADGIGYIFELEDLLRLNCEEKIKKEILNKISTDKIADGIEDRFDLRKLLELNCEEKIKKEILNKISVDKIADRIEDIFELKSFLSLNCEELIKTELQNKINAYIDIKLNEFTNNFLEKDLCKNILKSIFGKNIQSAKEYIEKIPKDKKITVYKQLLSLDKLDFFPGWRQKTLLSRLLKKADPLFFNTFNLQGQILNLSNNVGNDSTKINLLMAAYGKVLKEHFNNDELSKKIMISLKENSEQIVDFDHKEIDKDIIIDNIKKSVTKLDNGEISFIMTSCFAGKIHNIPQVLMKVPSGPLKNKYLMFFINFGAGSNSSVSVGSGTVTMFILNSNSRETIVNQMFHNINLANVVKATDMPEGNLVAFARETIHGFYINNYSAFSKETIDNIKKTYFNEDFNEKDTKGLGISLDLGNVRKGDGIFNCYVKQELVALEFIHSFLRTCEKNKTDITFDPISYLRYNSNKLSKNDNLKYTHLGPLSSSKSEGITTQDFKKLLIQKINQLTERGIKLNTQMAKLSSEENNQIMQELSQRRNLVKPNKPLTLSM